MRMIYGLVKSCYPRPNLKNLTRFRIFFILMAKLRLVLPFRYFAIRFNISENTVSKYFHICLSNVSSRLSSFVRWPTRDEMKLTMPLAFKENFGDSITIIIDCFEVQIEKSSFLKASAQSWSNYKHGHTIKCLIVISPQGSITYISVAYAGRSSDKYVTETCGFLDSLREGDVILADRGFLINAAVNERGASMKMPAFTKRRSQLRPLEIEQTRRIANVRIHVERIIGLMRSKFRILNQRKFPLLSIARTGANGKTVVDEIVHLCAALINLCQPICISANE